MAPKKKEEPKPAAPAAPKPPEPERPKTPEFDPASVTVNNMNINIKQIWGIFNCTLRGAVLIF